jgi:hypothetical protein
MVFNSGRMPGKFGGNHISATFNCRCALAFNPGIDLAFIPDSYSPAQPDRLRKRRVIFGEVPDMRAGSADLGADASNPEITSVLAVVMILG